MYVKWMFPQKILSSVVCYLWVFVLSESETAKRCLVSCSVLLGCEFIECHEETVRSTVALECFLSGVTNVVGRFRAGLISADQLVYQLEREKANNYFWQAMWGPSLRLRGITAQWWQLVSYATGQCLCVCCGSPFGHCAGGHADRHSPIAPRGGSSVFTPYPITLNLNCLCHYNTLLSCLEIIQLIQTIVYLDRMSLLHLVKYINYTAQKKNWV